MNPEADRNPADAAGKINASVKVKPKLELRAAKALKHSLWLR